MEDVQEATPRPVGLGHISGHSPDDVLVLIQHNVHDVVDSAESPGLLDVLPNGVTLQLSRAGIVLYYPDVVGPNSILGGKEIRESRAY